jgi:hypothetical protein
VSAERVAMAALEAFERVHFGLFPVVGMGLDARQHREPTATLAHEGDRRHEPGFFLKRHAPLIRGGRNCFDTLPAPVGANLSFGEPVVPQLTVTA